MFYQREGTENIVKGKVKKEKVRVGVKVSCFMFNVSCDGPLPLRDFP